MPNEVIEWGSYAQHLESRVIVPCWHSSRRRAGKFTFKTMTAKADVAHSWMTLIGYEMTTVHTYTNHLSNTGWVFRSYLDGTAFFNESLLERELWRWSAQNKVKEVIKKHYNLDTEMRVPNPNGHCDDTIKVYKRKPLSDYARTVALAQEASLGDYLVRKYNTGGDHATVI